MSITSKVVIVGGIESKSGVSPAKDGKPAKPWTRYSLKDQADHFVGSTFSDTIVGILKSNIGQQVTVEVEERENPDPMKQPYRDIVGAMPGVVATPAEVASVGRTSTDGAAPDRSIRAAALQAAVTLVTGTGAADDVLSIADKYVAWITETEQVQHMRAFDPDIPF